MIIERSFKQQSPEWFIALLGNPGATGIQRILTPKGKKAKTKYIYEMAEQIIFRDKFIEKIMTLGEAGFKSKAMDIGNEREPEARDFYSLLKGVEVEEVSMCYPNELKRWHISPDGLLVGQKKGLEIKNPIPTTHMAYLDNGELPNEYFMQIHGSMACTGYDAWDFMSYCPGLPEFIIEVPRDEALCAQINEAMDEFLFNLKKLVEKLS